MKVTYVQFTQPITLGKNGLKHSYLNVIHSSVDDGFPEIEVDRSGMMLKIRAPKTGNIDFVPMTSVLKFTVEE